MSTATRHDELPQATEALVRQHARDIAAAARTHQVSDLRVAATGELVGHLPDDADTFDVAAFELAVSEVIGGAEVFLVSDTVLNRDGIDPQLRAARPL